MALPLHTRAHAQARAGGRGGTLTVARHHDARGLRGLGERAQSRHGMKAGRAGDEECEGKVAGHLLLRKSVIAGQRGGEKLAPPSQWSRQQAARRDLGRQDLGFCRGREISLPAPPPFQPAVPAPPERAPQYKVIARMVAWMGRTARSAAHSVSLSLSVSGNELRVDMYSGTPQNSSFFSCS